MNNGVWWAAIVAAIVVAGIILRYFRQMHREALPKEKVPPPIIRRGRPLQITPGIGRPDRQLAIRGDYYDGERD